MRTKLLILTVLLILAIMGFIRSNFEVSVPAEISAPINNPSPKNNNWMNKFYIGAVEEDIDGSYNYSHLDLLGFSLWHHYTEGQIDTQLNKPVPKMNWVSNPNLFDKLRTPVSEYAGSVNAIINDIYSHNEGRKLIIMRPKIVWLCYGQRSDYKCAYASHINPELWFYSFQSPGYYDYDDFYDNLAIGDNKWVRQCLVSTTTPGLVTSKLKANAEQCHTAGYWVGDDYCDWLVKPRIRIPSNFPYSNPETPVCSLKVIAQDGVTILKEVVIKAKYFLDSSYQYYGGYIEEFNFRGDPYNLTISGAWGDKWMYTARGNHQQDGDNKADIQIYWYGNCDMWLDYIRIDNDVANRLLKQGGDPEFEQWIYDEVTQIGVGKIMKYYLELVEFNNLPCMAYVNSKLKQYSGGATDLIQDFTNTISSHVPWEDRTTIENPTFLYNQYIQKVGFTQIFSESYPMSACFETNPDLQNFSKIPITLHTTTGENILAKAVSSSLYDSYLQDNLNHKPYCLEGDGYISTPCENTYNNVTLYQDQGNFRYKLQTCDELSKKANIPFIFMPQAHQWYRYGEVRREPTNEEINMMVNVSVSYGVKGLMWFSYDSHFSSANDYGIGISELDKSLREYNFYHEGHDNLPSKLYKWETFQSITDRLSNKWGPYLLSFNNTDRHSFIYDFSNERASLINNSYFSNFATIRPGPIGLQTECNEDFIPADIQSGWLYDCQNNTYLQVATFGSIEPYSQYFMVVNRRCSPYINDDNDNNIGGHRKVRAYIHTNYPAFTGFYNWNIINCENNSIVATFNKSNPGYINFDYFLPGEGKLYKIFPVVMGGGNLVSDETISGNVNCNGMIYGNGHNITISPNATVTFSDSAGIEMNGGNFTCGDNSSTNINVTLKGKDNNTKTWKGLVLSNCSTIGIYNTNISKITANDTAKAVLISNCNNININNTSFSMGTNAGAIQAVFTSSSDEDITFNVSNCNFDMGSSGYSAISILSNASSSLPVIIDWCTFSTTNDTTNAILLSGVTGGAVKNSTFTNFASTINTLSSSIDVYGNTILGNTNSTGILCVDGSSISLSPYSGMYLGGFNYFRNYGTSANSIKSENSYFGIDFGKNNFDLNDIDNSKFLTGTFNGHPFTKVFATINCFHKDSVTNIEANHTVIWNSTSDPVNFIFTPYFCDLTRPNDFTINELNGYNDTIFRTLTGGSGGINPDKIISIEENVYKSLKDTININLRKRNYLTVEVNAKQILTQFPDSLKSIGMVQKLYMDSLKLDSTKIGLTKSFLENLIVNNSQNPGLVKRAFYFIQKCKVKLKQYQSALDGFQYIMTQNPYTYEGLVASWDYAATYLLMGAGGSYKGDLEQATEELNTPADTLLNRMTKSDINTNKTKNTNSNKTSIEQITKTFYEKIKNVTKDDKSIQEAKVKTLEKTIETTKNKTEKNDASKELAKMKQIKETVKIKKPNTVKVHITMINDDIKKVFGIGKNSKNETTNNLIPKTYALYQNYPNPFNPTTKIAYDIPKDAKVKLVIYDILGREMKTLVNNEFRSAGKYITEFNGSYLSSGIYFARILVNEGKDFMAVKKLVLLK